MLYDERDSMTLEERMERLNESNIESHISFISMSNNSFEYKYHYACPNCHTFPIIYFNDRQLIIKCKDSNGVKMDINDYLKYKTTKDRLSSFDPINEYKGYCFYCKKSFYENNSNEHKEHNFKNYEDIINFIRNRQNLPQINLEENSEPSLIQREENMLFDRIKFEEKDGMLMSLKTKDNTNIDNLYLNEPLESLIFLIIQDIKLYPNISHYENIKNIFYYLSDQLEIEYHNYGNQSSEIKIFGKSFVKNNAKIFILFIDEKEEILKEKIEVKGNNETFKIKLIKINEATDLSGMFYKCDSLYQINIINKWDTSNVTTMNRMFSGCNALENLPDLSKWITNKVTDLSSIFEDCENLEIIPDISKWNVENVISMSYMFSGCESLEFLPDLSKWKTNKLENIDSIFHNCKNLKSLEGIENWDTSQITNMSSSFENCWSLTDFGDISKWNTKKVRTFSNIFAECKNLTRLPDLSKWDTQNVKEMRYMFSNCKKLETLPDISKWNVRNVISMNNMFENCSNLKAFPDISNWIKDKDLDASFMLKGCDLLKKIPNLNK